MNLFNAVAVIVTCLLFIEAGVVFALAFTSPLVAIAIFINLLASAFIALAFFL